MIGNKFAKTMVYELVAIIGIKRNEFLLAESKCLGLLLYGTSKPKIITVCPGSSELFYIASLLYKMGHYFLDILYFLRL